MPMTTVITRNVSDRMRGLLASSMLELSPGVYVAPRMSAGVRQRLWAVLKEWWPHECDASLILIRADSQAVCGQTVETMGIPPIDLIEVDGLVLARRSRT